jgi:hypothetical protein
VLGSEKVLGLSKLGSTSARGKLYVWVNPAAEARHDVLIPTAIHTTSYTCHPDPFPLNPLTAILTSYQFEFLPLALVPAPTNALHTNSPYQHALTTVSVTAAQCQVQHNPIQQTQHED